MNSCYKQKEVWRDGDVAVFVQDKYVKAHLFEWLLLHDNAALLLSVVGCKVKRVGACAYANMPP